MATKKVNKSKQNIKKTKYSWKSIPAWLKGGIIGALFGLISGLPIFLLLFNITSPKIIINISNYIYAPAIFLFTKFIFFPLSKLGVNFYLDGLFFSIMFFAIIFYFFIGALIAPFIKRIIERRKEILK